MIQWKNNQFVRTNRQILYGNCPTCSRATHCLDCDPLIERHVKSVKLYFAEPMNWFKNNRRPTETLLNVVHHEAQPIEIAQLTAQQMKTVLHCDYNYFEQTENYDPQNETLIWTNQQNNRLIKALSSKSKCKRHQKQHWQMPVHFWPPTETTYSTIERTTQCNRFSRNAGGI